MNSSARNLLNEWLHEPEEIDRVLERARGQRACVRMCVKLWIMWESEVRNGYFHFIFTSFFSVPQSSRDVSRAWITSTLRSVSARSACLSCHLSSLTLSVCTFLFSALSLFSSYFFLFLLYFCFKWFQFFYYFICVWQPLFSAGPKISMVFVSPEMALPLFLFLSICQFP